MAGSTYTVERSATIAAAPEAIYERVVDLRKWPAWSPWEGRDPAMTTSYSGADQGVGSVYEWAGNRKVGHGRMEITDAKPNEEIAIALSFLKPFKSENTSKFAFAADGDATTVTWSMTAPQTLMTRIMGVFMSMDKMVGKDFEQGLSQLKAEVEKA